MPEENMNPMRRLKPRRGRGGENVGQVHGMWPEGTGTGRDGTHFEEAVAVDEQVAGLDVAAREQVRAQYAVLCNMSPKLTSIRFGARLDSNRKSENR